MTPKLTHREWYYIHLIVLIGCVVWLTGCSISRLDKRSAEEMRTDQEYPYHYGEGKQP